MLKLDNASHVQNLKNITLCLRSLDSSMMGCGFYFLIGNSIPNEKKEKI